MHGNYSLWYWTQTPHLIFLNHPIRSFVTLRTRKNGSMVQFVNTKQYSSFTPLCATIDGLIDPEMSLFINAYLNRLFIKWEQPYSITLNKVRTKLSFALVRASNLCIRGSGSKWRGLSIEDGWGINPNFYRLFQFPIIHSILFYFIFLYWIICLY